MKSASIFLFAISFLVFSNWTQAAHYAVVLPHYVGSTEANANAQHVIELLGKLKPNDDVLLIDGYKLATLGTLVVPEGPVFSTMRARVNYNRDAIAGFLKFVEECALPKGGDEPTIVGAIRFPQLLHHIATTATHSEQIQVIVLGSAIYDVPSDTGYSMSGGPIIPSDGHILASPSASPFGTLGREGLLKNIKIAYGFRAEDFPYASSHQYFVERFYTLMVERQGGKLVAFTSDIPALLAKVLSGTASPPHDYTLNVMDKLEMLYLGKADSETIFEKAVETAPPAKDLLVGARNVQVGLSWDCEQCDLDLHARAFPDSVVLSFNNSNTVEGKYWKEFRIGADVIRGLETIEYHVPVDLNELMIAVNHYDGGNAGGVNAEVRIAIDGKVYAKTYHIATTAGNKGQDVIEAFRSETPSNNTLLIDPVDVLGLGN